MERFIGLDVHRPSTTCAVIDARGKRLRVDVVETNGQTLIEFLKLQPGTLRLCMEEGTQALWLAEILSPHVEQLAVVHVTESRGPKDDERDALALAEQMRTGKLDTTLYAYSRALAGAPEPLPWPLEGLAGDEAGAHDCGPGWERSGGSTPPGGGDWISGDRGIEGGNFRPWPRPTVGPCTPSLR